MTIIAFSAGSSKNVNVTVYELMQGLNIEFFLTKKALQKRN